MSTWMQAGFDMDREGESAEEKARRLKRERKMSLTGDDHLYEGAKGTKDRPGRETQRGKSIVVQDTQRGKSIVSPSSVKFAPASEALLEEADEEVGDSGAGTSASDALSVALSV